MLDSFRKRKDNFIYSGIILVTAVVMGFYGVDQLNDDGKDPGIAAWVNGESISQRDLQQEMERRVYQYQSMFGGQFDTRMLGPDFPKQILEQLVRSKLIAQQAKKMSLIVTDEELADFIRGIPAYQKDGKFDSSRYTQITNRGILEKGWRERLEAQKFQDYLEARIRFTPAELRRSHGLKETKIDLSYAKIDFQSLARNQKPSAKSLNEFKKATPESEFQTYYDAHLADYSEKAKVRLKQIRIGIPYQASELQKKEAKKKIDSIASGLNAQNFSDTARKSSDDEFAQKGGDAGWITRQTLEAPLEEAIGRLKPGEVSPPVEASFGHFIFQLVEEKPATQKPLDSVKGEISEKLYLAKFEKEYSESTRKRWEEALLAGRDIEGELKAAKVEIKKSGPFSIGQREIPGIGASESILDAAFDLTPERPISKSLHFFQDRYYYVKLTKFDRAKPFDPAKDTESTESSMKSTALGQILKDWVTQLEKRSSKKLLVSSNEEPTAVQ